MGRGETKKKSMRRRGRWGRGEWIFAIRISFFFLTLWSLNVYFDFNLKCLFCSEFCWMMMIFKIKIIIRLFFSFIYFYLSNYSFLIFFSLWYGTYRQVIKIIGFVYTITNSSMWPWEATTAKIWELIGILKLSQLSRIFDNENIVLSREDGIIIIKLLHGPKLDKYRKE